MNTKSQEISSSFATETIESALKKLNESYFLPALQRDYVWSKDQICALFDSLMQGYPISTFLFWKVPAENSEAFEKYYFLNVVKAKDNKPGERSGRPSNELIFVLDGQQRLTSLNVGLRGEFDDKKRKDERNKELYFDIIHNKDYKDEDTGCNYKFEFKDGEYWRERNGAEPGEYFVLVSEIYKQKSKDELEEYINKKLSEQPKLSENEKMYIHQNLERFHKVLFTDQLIGAHTEETDDQAKMLEIFMRANNGGTALKKSELMLSTLTLHWSREGHPTETAKGAITSLIKELNKSLPPGDKEKNKLEIDFIMKACLVLLEQAVAYRMKSFTKKSCEKICKNWDAIKNALHETVELVAHFGLTSTTLLSRNALIPIAYYIFHKKTKDIKWSYRSANNENLSNIRNWLYGAMLNGIFSGSSDNILGSIRTNIRNSNYEFNIPALDQATRDCNENPVANINTFVKMMELTYKKSAECRIALSLLSTTSVGAEKGFHIDHLFSQKSLKDTKHSETMNDFANLCMLAGTENSSKKDKSLEVWLDSFDMQEKFLEDHLIPKDRSLWVVDKYEQFLEARKELLEARFKEIYSLS